MLKLSGIPRSTYYYYLKESKKVDKYKDIKALIMDIFNENNKSFGYRRILLALQAKGIVINHKTVLKLMKKLGIKGKVKAEKYKSYKGEQGESAENIINRDFRAEKPYEKLTTDVTQFNVCGEKIYLSPVLDMYSNEILSYSVSKSPNFWQTRQMLERLFDDLPEGSRPILHSDQGWQYRLKSYCEMLEEHNITRSMSRKGNCLDNSIMESFFGRLKVEMFYGETFKSADEFISRLEEYIHYYNNKRISEKTKGLTPVEFRNQSLIA